MTRISRTLLVVSSLVLSMVWAHPATAVPPQESADDIMCRGASAEGFSYWWGGECWCRNGCSPDLSCGAGGCSGSCPDCTHWGSYGADCSGFVSRAWQVPYAIPVDACHTERYVAASFNSSGAHWTQVSRSNVQRADALASTSHVVLFDNGDGWGWMNVYEAKGCSYGIVYNGRSCSSSYNAARRDNITSCQCTAGQTDSRGCGNCGTQTRTCQADCQWSAWSTCQGEGPCSPGATESRGCCDCGTENRSCQNDCQWSDWSECEGPDPDGGNLACDTGLTGLCGEGRMRCEQGCLLCEPVQVPGEEVCDGVDNDCDGVVDDGSPETMGPTPPAFAARLTEQSHPQSLEPGETAVVWATFENVGTETWLSQQVWVAAMAARNGDSSRFYHAQSWPFQDVPFVLEEDVPPGAVLRVEFTIEAPQVDGEQIIEAFRLGGPGGKMMDCPAPEFDLEVLVVGDVRNGPNEPSPEEETLPEEGQGAQPIQPDIVGGCGCRVGPTQRPALPGLLMLILVAGLAFALRGSRRTRP